MAAIYAVVVLYKCSFEESDSLTSLIGILNQHPEWAEHFSLLVYDNSPQPQALVETAFHSEYFHDASNPGLASAYSAAFAGAERDRCEWLMLLDQDTQLTDAYVGELLAVAGHVPENVGAIVPKLLVKGALHSPAKSFLSEVRRIRRPGKSVYLQASGLQQEHLVAYNSGSVMRVSALRAIGGFPAEFWLDFLDHAVFHKLFSRGYRIYILRASLRHDFSESQVEKVPAWRQLNVLRARSLYVKQNGRLMDRLLYRIWLLRHARSLRRAGADAQVWKKTTLAAVWWPGKDKR